MEIKKIEENYANAIIMKLKPKSQTKPNFAKTILLSALVGLIFLSTSCGSDTTGTKEPQGLLKYRIINEEVYDKPIKTEVSFSVIIEENDFDESQIKQLLHYLYEKTISRSGFQHHDYPTSIFIWAYSSEEKAKSGMGQWVGMISKSSNEENPKIDISEAQLNVLTEGQAEKLGLPYQTRQEIWTKLIIAERKAQSEADKKHPLDKPGITQEDMSNNVDLMSALKEQYENDIATEYNIDRAVLDSISLEGITSGWAFPER